MLLIGVNRSPFTRRVAITHHLYGMSFEQRPLSGFADRDAVRKSNPLGRIPALVLDSGETLIDSNAIIDHLDEVYGHDRPLTPPGGADRACERAVRYQVDGVETTPQGHQRNCGGEVAQIRNDPIRCLVQGIGRAAQDQPDRAVSVGQDGRHLADRRVVD